MAAANSLPRRPRVLPFRSGNRFQALQYISPAPHPKLLLHASHLHVAARRHLHPRRGNDAHHHGGGEPQEEACASTSTTTTHLPLPTWSRMRALPRLLPGCLRSTTTGAHCPRQRCWLHPLQVASRKRPVKTRCRLLYFTFGLGAFPIERSGGGNPPSERIVRARLLRT